MSIELKIPEVGESIVEVQIAEWLKAEGDTVQKDEPLVVLDSEKTTLELPAPEGGTLSKILHRAGETVAVGEVIGHLEGADGRVNPPRGAKPAGRSAATDAPKPSADSRPDAARTPVAATSKAESRPRPSTKREGAPPPSPPKVEPGPESPEVALKPEVASAELSEPASASAANESAAPPAREPAADGVQPPSSSPIADGEEETVPMSMLRRTAARRLVEAKQQMAMTTTFNEVDMSGVQALRREHQEAFAQRYQVKLGLMSSFVKAAVDALKQFPQLNAQVRGNDIVYRNYFNIGVAIATRRGLVVPVLRRAERLSFAEVERAIDDFARRANDGKLKPDELDGATFTITNGGVFGSLLSTPIINPPQSGILGMHAIQERPVVRQGQVVIRPMMYLALTYDHRIVDGREAVLFTRRVKEAIESPARMLLEV